MKLGAKGMDLTYDDTITDLAETAAGALLGGVVTCCATRRGCARCRDDRRTPWSSFRMPRVRSHRKMNDFGP